MAKNKNENLFRNFEELYDSFQNGDINVDEFIRSITRIRGKLKKKNIDTTEIDRVIKLYQYEDEIDNSDVSQISENVQSVEEVQVAEDVQPVTNEPKKLSSKELLAQYREAYEKQNDSFIRRQELTVQAAKAFITYQNASDEEKDEAKKRYDELARERDAVIEEDEANKAEYSRLLKLVIEERNRIAQISKADQDLEKTKTPEEPVEEVQEPVLDAENIEAIVAAAREKYIMSRIFYINAEPDSEGKAYKDMMSDFAEYEGLCKKYGVPVVEYGEEVVEEPLQVEEPPKTPEEPSQVAEAEPEVSEDDIKIDSAFGNVQELNAQLLEAKAKIQEIEDKIKNASPEEQAELKPELEVANQVYQKLYIAMQDVMKNIRNLYVEEPKAAPTIDEDSQQDAEAQEGNPPVVEEKTGDKKPSIPELLEKWTIAVANAISAAYSRTMLSSKKIELQQQIREAAPEDKDKLEADLDEVSAKLLKAIEEYNALEAEARRAKEEYNQALGTEIENGKVQALDESNKGTSIDILVQRYEQLRAEYAKSYDEMTNAKKEGKNAKFEVASKKYTELRKLYERIIKIIIDNGYHDIESLFNDSQDSTIGEVEANHFAAYTIMGVFLSMQRGAESELDDASDEEKAGIEAQITEYDKLFMQAIRKSNEFRAKRDRMYAELFPAKTDEEKKPSENPAAEAEQPTAEEQAAPTAEPEKTAAEEQAAPKQPITETPVAEHTPKEPTLEELKAQKETLDILSEDVLKEHDELLPKVQAAYKRSISKILTPEQRQEAEAEYKALSDILQEIKNRLEKIAAESFVLQEKINNLDPKAVEDVWIAPVVEPEKPAVEEQAAPTVEPEKPRVEPEKPDVVEQAAPAAPKKTVAEDRQVPLQSGDSYIPKIPNLDDSADWEKIATNLGLDITEIVSAAQALAATEAAAAVKNGKSPEAVVEKGAKSKGKELADQVKQTRENHKKRRDEAKEFDYLGQFAKLVEEGFDRVLGWIKNLTKNFEKDGKARKGVNAVIGEIRVAPGNIGDNISLGLKTTRNAAVNLRDNISKKFQEKKITIKGFVKDIRTVLKADEEKINDGTIKLTGKKQDLALAIGKGLRRIRTGMKSIGKGAMTVGTLATAPIWLPVKGAISIGEYAKKFPGEVSKKYTRLKSASLDRKIARLRGRKTNLETKAANLQTKIDGLENAKKQSENKKQDPFTEER